MQFSLDNTKMCKPAITALLTQTHTCTQRRGPGAEDINTLRTESVLCPGANRIHRFTAVAPGYSRPARGVRKGWHDGKHVERCATSDMQARFLTLIVWNSAKKQRTERQMSGERGGPAAATMETQRGAKAPLVASLSQALEKPVFSQQITLAPRLHRLSVAHHSAARLSSSFDFQGTDYSLHHDLTSTQTSSLCPHWRGQSVRKPMLFANIQIISIL